MLQQESRCNKSVVPKVSRGISATEAARPQQAEAVSKMLWYQFLNKLITLYSRSIKIVSKEKIFANGGFKGGRGGQKFSQ